MNRATPGLLLATAYVATAICSSREAQASVVTSVDSFETVMSSPPATDWGVFAIGTPQTGTDILGTRQVSTIAYWQATPIHEISIVGSGDGEAVITTRGDGHGSGARVQLRGTISYRNFGVLNLSAPGQTIRMAGSGVYGHLGAATVISVTISSTTGSSVAEVLLSESSALGNIDFDTSSLVGTADLANVSGIDLTVRSDCGINAYFSLEYRMNQLLVLPCPSTAPLLALAGLTARGRRRR
jgi:hypothetical protein